MSLIVQQGFGIIAVATQSSLSSATGNILTIAAGSGITLATNASTNTLTINATGAGGSPVGPNFSVQFNNSGAFGGDSGLVYNSGVLITSNLEVTTFATFDNDATFKENIILYSPNGARFGSISVADTNRLIIENVDEIQVVDGGFRSNNYVTCTDLYLGNNNGSSYQEVHAFLDNSNVWQFLQSSGTGATANFQIPVNFQSTISLNSGSNQINLDPTGLVVQLISATNDIAMHLDAGSGAGIFYGSSVAYWNFQDGDVIVDQGLQVGSAIEANGGIDVGANQNIDFLNSDASARFTFANDSVTPSVSTALLSNLTFLTIDAPIYPTAIYSSPTAIFIDNAARLIYDPVGQAVMNFTSNKRIGLVDGVFLDFFNLTGDHSCSITNNGTAGQSIEDHNGADFYRFDADLRFSAWSDSSGNPQASVDLTGFGLPQLTPSTLLSLDASNYVASIPTASLAAEIIPILIAGTALNGSYFLTQKANYAGTITAFSAAASSLTTAGTYTIAINGTPVTGLNGITNTTASTETNAIAANTFVIGDIITITFTGTLTLVNFEGQLSLIRAV